MKLLIKQCFKTIFCNKIFSLILMIIIFISSLTYTLLQSSTNAFQESYNNLVHNGNLHDLVAKQLYNNNGHLSLEVVKNNEKSQSQATNQYFIQVKKDGASGDYSTYFENHPEDRKWAVTFSADLEDENLDSEKSKKLIERQEFLEKKVNEEKPLAFQKVVKHIYGEKLAIKNTNSLAITVNKQAFKFVEENNNKQINNLVIYDGTSKFTNPLSDEAMRAELEIRAKQVLAEDYTINSLKGFRWTAQAFNNSVAVTDPSSFQAIISPSFANLNHKRAISAQEVLRLYEEHNYFENIHENEELKNKYAHNMVWVDQTPYFIIGIGVTPDFSFPIVDQTRPIPIPQDEAIVYTNKRGYERIVDGFRHNPRENYFSFKYQEKFTASETADIIKNLEDIARNGKDASIFSKNPYLDYLPSMSWPSNVKIVTKYNENNNGIILVDQRIVFLQNLKNTINVLTISTTSFLIIFVSAIVVLIFKSLLAIRRIKNATLIALGYSKKSIAASISLVTIVLVGLPSIMGYVFGHFLQYPFINIFAQYWTIPTYGSAFSIISFMITVVIPITLIFAMIFILTSWDLNEKLTNMLRGKSKYKFSLVQIILKPFVWTNVKAKYITSLTISNMGRLILSTLAGIISVSTIIVGISSIGRADYAYNQTINVSKYTFQANLASPTIEGGQYQTITYEKAIERLNSNQKYDDGIHWHIPSMADASVAVPSFIVGNDDNWQEVRTFLKNKLQFKPLLDLTIGPVNSWEIAKKLMPDNQRNTAESNEKTFYKLTTTLVEELDKDKASAWRKRKWWPQAKDDFKVNAQNKMANDGFSLDEQFVEFIKWGLINLYKQNSNFIPYIISYNVVITNNEDEKYTYINTQINHKNANIIGMNPDTKYFNLDDFVRNKLKNYDAANTYPLIINQYMAEKHDWKIGHKITLPVLNHQNRNISKTKIEADFEVVDIINTYDDDRLITSQKASNKIIFESSNNFNGLFTSHQKPVVLNILPLYSESDFYIGTDTITDVWRSIVDKIINDLLKNHNPNYHIKNSADLISIYSKTPYVAMFNKVVWNEITNSTFFNISKLASDIIWIIQIISIVLSILFAIIVSSLLITSNSKKIATLWTLGYRRSEVMRMFSFIYLLPIILSVAIGIPIALGILTTLRMFVINFGSILIPFALAWWAIVLALFFIGAIFIFSTIISIMRIKNEQARKTIQEE